MLQYPLNQAKNKRVIISLGGALIIPQEVDTAYLAKFRKFILEELKNGWKFFIITGGGAQARKYINSAQKIMGKEITKDDMDWLGIHATRFNAQLVRTMFRDQAQPEVITDPEKDKLGKAPIIVVSGWKPGWSTDLVASKIAQRVNAPYVINLSNIAQIYTDDPKKNPNAKPVEKMTWPEYRKIIGNEWTPGMNTPYDPIASQLAEKEGQTVLTMDGKNLTNLKNAFTKGKFKGTILVPAK